MQPYALAESKTTSVKRKGCDPNNPVLILLFIKDIIASGIVGAAIELPVFPGSQYKITTAARTFAAGHGCIPAFFVAVDVVKVPHAV